MFLPLADGYTGAEVAGTITAVILAVGGLITGVVGAVISLRKNRADSQAAREKSALETYREMLERQEKQIARHERHAESQQQVIDAIADDHSRCQQQLASFWEWMQRANELLAWLSSQARSSGLNPGPEIKLPEPPEREERPERAARQSQQNTQLLKDSHPENPILNPPTGGRP